MKKLLTLILCVIMITNAVLPCLAAEIDFKSDSAESAAVSAENSDKSEDVTKAEIWDGSVATWFDGGSGTETDPYRIATGAQLAYLRKQVNAGTTYEGKYFELTADIVLNDTSNWKDWENSAPKNECIPIGTYTWSSSKADYPFSGTFDGDGHTVSGVYISTTAYEAVGLFGYVKNGTVKNIGCIESYICRESADSRAYAGGLVGRNYSGTIENSYATGDVSATSSSSFAYAGGLVGEKYGTITNSYATGDVSATASSSKNSNAGGLVGYNYKSTITNSYATGDVSATTSSSSYARAGGLVGENDGTITNSYATGDVSATTSSSSHARAGGLVGENDGTITNSYATGDVSATSSSSFA